MIIIYIGSLAAIERACSVYLKFIMRKYIIACRVPYKRQELLILRVFTPRFGLCPWLLIFLVFCVVLCFCMCVSFVFVLCLVYPILSLSLVCPFLIAPSGFSNVYITE